MSALWFVWANQQIEWKIARLCWRMNTLVWRILILFFDIPLWTVCTSIIDQMNSFGAQFGFPLFSRKKRCNVRIVYLKKVRLAQRKGKIDPFNMPTKNNTNKHVWSIFCSSLPQIALRFVNIWSEVNQEVYMSIISSSPRFLSIFFGTIKVDHIKRIS